MAELTRSSSDSSGLTSDDSDRKSIAEHCECVAQADEMHEQYLNRLEASFVIQLHSSTSWLARWPNRSMKRNLSVNQQDKKASEQATTGDSYDVYKSPWVKHFNKRDKHCSFTGAPAVNECSKNHPELNLLRDPRISSNKIGRYSADIAAKCFSSGGSISEGSGQNFVHEDRDKDATFRVKKSKLAVTDTSSADQIVPSSEIDAKIHPIIAEIPTGDQARSQSLSEYRNIVIPKPASQSLLRWQ